jgi:hypothetical protein
LDAAPATGKNFEVVQAAPAPAPTLLCKKPTFVKSTKVGIRIGTFYFYDSCRYEQEKHEIVTFCALFSTIYLCCTLAMEPEAHFVTTLAPAAALAP